MQKDLKPTIHRLIERREMQLDEIAVLKIIHTNKKEGVTEKEDLAKISMTLTKLEDSEKEVLNEIAVYKNLLETI